jgi:hypothetical protein
MQNSPKAKKAAKTRATNARFCAAAAKTRAEVALSAQTTIEKRSKAYRDMEPYVGDLVRAALFLFAVSQLDDMAQRFKANYYKNEFPPE